LKAPTSKEVGAFLLKPIRITRIPQWKSDAVNEGQTLRNEDNAFLPLSSGQISLLCEFCQSNKALCQAAEKTLKQHPWVSSPLQVRPSLMFNCGIRDDAGLKTFDNPKRWRTQLVR